MSLLETRFAKTLLCAAVAGIFAVPLPESAQAAASKYDGKVVLVNADKYEVNFRLGKLSKTIAPRKASVLGPKKYPISFEYWTGNKSSGWAKQSISAAGVYTFGYKGGKWSLTERKPRATASAGATAKTNQAVKAPSRSRAVGSQKQVVRVGGPVARSRGTSRGRSSRGRRMPGYTTAERILGSVGSIYRFARDERDRDLLRRAFKDGIRSDRAWDKALRDWAKDPKWGDDARAELYGHLDDLSKLNDKDFDELDKLTGTDWDDLKEDLGDKIDDGVWNDWDDFKNDLDEAIDVDDITDADIDTMGEVGLDDLDVDVDLGDLDGLDVDLDDFVDDIDIDDMSIDADDFDYGAFDDMDVDLGDDFGGDDGGFDLDPGDYGGGDDFDFGGGDDWGGDDFGGDDFGGFDDF